MIFSSERLQALRDCCRDDAAFAQLQQILAGIQSEDASINPLSHHSPEIELHHPMQTASNNGNLPASGRSESGLMRGVAEATSQLLTSQDYTQAIDAALATLGQATQVDRVYLFESHPHSITGEPAVSQRFEWVRDSITPQLDNPELQNRTFAASGLLRWYELFKSGQLFCALVQELPPTEQAVLVAQDILSILLVPILIDGELWGVIGFDDCSTERYWSADEAAALQIMATSLGGAIARQQAESALRQSEWRLHNIAANVPGMIYQCRRGVDGTYQVLYASSGSRELLELEPIQIESNTCLLRSLCHPDDRSTFETSINTSAATLQPWNWEGRIITPSGKLKWVQGVARPERQLNGDLSWDGLLVDISDRKFAEAECRLSEARYRAMLDASPDLMFRLNQEGQYLDFKANNTANIPPAGIVGRYLHDLLPVDVADLCLATIHKTLETETLQTCEYQLSEPDGVRDYEARVVVSGKDEVLWIVQDVTERKQAEQEIRQSEARNRALVDAIPDLMFRIRRDGTYLDCKVDSDDDTLIPPQELIGKTVYDVLPSEQAQLRMYYIEQALATGQSQRFEYRLRFDARTRASQLYQAISPDLDRLSSEHGSMRDYEARLVVCGEDEVLVIVRDITERKLSEAALRRSEEKFAKAFHASPNSLAISTLEEGRVIDVNESFLKISGYQRQEVIGRTTQELQLWLNPGDRHQMIQSLQQNGSVRDMECQFRMKWGGVRTTLLSAEVVHIGNEACLLSMVVDITERKQAEQQLWAAAERDRLVRDIALRIRESLDLKQILDTTVVEIRQFLQVDRVYIGQFDPNDPSVMVAEAESVDPHYPSILGGGIDPEHMSEVKAMFAGGQMRVVNNTHAETEYPAIAAYYTEYQIQAGIVAPIMLDHQLYGVLVANQCCQPREWQAFEIDLLRQLATHVAIAIQQAQLYKQVQDLNTGLEQQVAERTAELQQRMEELQDLNQLKDEFLNAFSHDLRTPIMGISLVIGNLLNQPGETIAISRSIFERMAQSSNHQLQLINSLLQAHSAETRGVILNYELVQLSLLTQVIVEDLEPLVSKNQARLTNQVPPDLPLVNADPVQLRRVFENLITNALHHNPPGVNLTLNAHIESDMIRLMLQDDGVGMASEVSDRIFERYSRGTQSRHSTGIGLGLYLCRQIITAHGGQIGVDSTPGNGSTFWLTLPLAISSIANTDPHAVADA
jgi:PAS domain S-box-containing protein